VHPMVFLPGVGGVPGAVQVQDHAVGPRPLGHRLDRGEANGQVDHDDDAADLLGERRPLVDVFHGGRGDIEVVALDLAGGLYRAVDALHGGQGRVAGAGDGVGGGGFVVRGEVGG